MYFSSKYLLIILVVLLNIWSISCHKSTTTAPSKNSSSQTEIPASAISGPPALVAGLTDGKSTISDVAETSIQSVVNIASTKIIRQRGNNSPFHGNPFFEHFFGLPQMPREERARSLGSGVIITADGVIITNNHVVEQATEIAVKLHDGRVLGAKVLGADPKSDLAVLRLSGKPEKLQPIKLGASGKLRLGEVVLAIGNPFGVGMTVTMGIVSALGRANMGIVDYEDFIQTDAAINPGNSGGALINLRGELVGINTAIFSKSGGYQGIGFAIPMDMVKPVTDNLIKYGKMSRGWLGVAIQDLNEEIARALKTNITQGVLISDVPAGTPAAKAGLRRGDIITQLDGKLTESAAHLRNFIATSGAHRRVKLSLIRDGKNQTVEVELAENPTEASARIEQNQGALGGLTVEPLSSDLKNRFGLPAQIGGVLVRNIEKGSPAEAASLQEGDIILEINRQPVTNAAQFANIYRRASDKVLLLVFREGNTMYLLLNK